MSLIIPSSRICASPGEPLPLLSLGYAGFWHTPILFPVEDFLLGVVHSFLVPFPGCCWKFASLGLFRPSSGRLLVVLLVTYSFSSAFAGHLGSACSCLLDLAGCPCCCFYTCATGCFSFQFLGCACFYILAAFPWTVLVD